MSSENNNQNERVWLHSLIISMFKKTSKETIIVVLLLSSVLLFFWNDIEYCEEQAKQMCSDCITILSCVLGLTITGYSVILTLCKRVVKKLSQPFRAHEPYTGFMSKFRNSIIKWLHPSESNPYDILCSSFVLCCIILSITIISLVLFKNHPMVLFDNHVLFGIIKWLCINSTLLVLDLIFHLFAISTYIKKDSNR